MKFVPVVLLCFVVALASADIIHRNNNINQGDTNLEHISPSIKNIPNSDAAKENEKDVIVDEDNINELDIVGSEESKIEDESAVKDDDIDEESAIKQGDQVYQQNLSLTCIFNIRVLTYLLMVEIVLWTLCAYLTLTKQVLYSHK